ncbi:AAA family ATPase [Streptomyces sp. NBC_00878]|uniref:caspase, EACC1-associated type n=1 Tax=Streptomyces sp. NBC_00878 TaxID=2975854 RepID=UPI0022532FCE|nr:AAA family ATPase [Streptomyces sp. NBC_00878]MCX4903119.1 caspase family protein [Streptomyces sp. NBC_00878]
MSDLSERPGRLLLPALASPGSRALLIGTGSHPDGSGLPSVPAVASTLTDLGQLLVERCGLAERNLVVVRDPADSRELGLSLADQAEQAEDVLFVYYVGHGLVSPGGDLHLATRFTDRRANRLSHTAFAYAGVRDCLLSSPARSIVVVLDCCYSGRAIGTLGSAAEEGTQSDAAQLARVHGAYVLTSTGGEDRALAPPGQPHTAFSGELIRLLREGEPDAPAYLTLRHLYRGLDRRLRERGFPRPSQQVSDWAEDLVLAPNPAYVPPQRVNGHRPADDDSRQPHALSGVCPYPGLASFGAGNSQWYRGREALTSALAERLGERMERTGPLFVLGPSGSGKSSLLRAGLLPALVSGAVPVPGARTWPHVLLTPTATPVRSLATALSTVTGDSREGLAGRLTEDPSALAAVLRDTMRARGGGAVTGARMVLLVDQFEELFTQCESESEREAFVRALCTAAASPAPGQEPPSLVVLCVRSDFYDQCARIAELREALEGGQVVVGPMSVPELRAAIQQPAGAVGLALEPGFAEPDASMLLAAEAFRQGLTTEARGALLSAQGQRLAGVLPGHRGSVTSAAFSPDGKLLATAAADRTVRLWDVSTRRRVAVLTGHRAAVASVASSPDGRHVATGGADGTVRLWNAAAHRVVAALTGNEGPVTAVAFSPDGKRLAVGSRDATIALWAPDTNSRLARLAGHGKGVDNGGVLALAFSPDSRTLVSGGDDKTVRLWDTRKREALAVLEGHGNSVTTVAFAPSGASVASGGTDGAVKLWDVARRRLLSDVDSNPAQVRSVVFSPDSRLIAVGNDTGDTEIWTVEDGQYVTEFTGHADAVLTVAFSRDGTRIATGGVDRTVRLWSTDTSVLTLRPDTEKYRVAVSHHGRWIAAYNDHDDSVDLWDLKTQRHIASLPDAGELTWGLAFSPDDGLLASAGPAGKVRVWDTASRRSVAVLDTTSPKRKAQAVHFSPDGRGLAAADGMGNVTVWDTDEFRTRMTLKGHEGAAFGVKFSPDGRTIASVGEDSTLRLWDARSGRALAVLDNHAGMTFDVAYTPDGRTLITGNNDGTVQVWDVGTRRKRAKLDITAGTVYGIAVDAKGTSLAVANSDGTIQLWDIPSERRTATLTGHTLGAITAAFSPSGSTLVSSGNDTIRLWDLDVDRATRHICDVVGTAVDRDRWRKLMPDVPFHAPCS